MAVEVKFCGLTRAVDAALGAALGASYLGVVFAESPRRVDAEGARSVFAQVPESLTSARRVGVFGATRAREVAQIARAVRLSVVQLHGDPSSADVASLRDVFDGEIWAARRIGARIPDDLHELASVADRVLIDARPANGAALGGTGKTFNWELLAEALVPLRTSSRFVLAGGLTPVNVGRAIELLAPSVVDVSSGVERAPGIKDEALMRAFVRAAGGGGGGGGEGGAFGR